MPATRFLDAAQTRRGRVTSLLGDIVHTPSLSSDEHDVVHRLREQMLDGGYDEVFVEPFGSIVGRIGDGPIKIVYDSHVDTVDVGRRSEWDQEPFEPRIADDVLYGRGACDDKGGIAAMVEGGALYKELGASADVTLYVVGSVQEEDCDGLALEHVLTDVLPRPDLVVLGEPTRCQVYRGHRGRIEVMVKTKGSSCHASMPQLGHNPVYDIAPIVADIQALDGRLPVDAFLGKGTVALTKIECETPSLNAVPGSATIYLDRRLTEGETPAAALAEIAALPSVQAVGGKVELLTYERTSFTGMRLGQDKEFHTWSTPEGSPAVLAGVAAVGTALDRTTEVGAWTFSTNGVASMGKLGIPTIGFGPGDEIHAHTVHDQCPIPDLVDAMAWYAAFPAVYAASVAAATRS